MSAFGTRSKSEVFLAAKNGCRRSQDIFLGQNRGLVTKITQRYLADARLARLHDDVIQEGMMGMHRAFEKFDIDKGYNFSTYAVPWIRVFVERFLQGALIQFSMPTRTRALAWKIRGLSRSFSLEAISVSLEMDLALTTSLYEMCGSMPIDMLDEVDGHSVEDLVVMQAQIGAVTAAFEKLPLIEKDALLIKLGEHANYEAVSGYLTDQGVTRHDFEKSAKISMAVMQSAIGA